MGILKCFHKTFFFQDVLPHVAYILKNALKQTLVFNKKHTTHLILVMKMRSAYEMLSSSKLIISNL